jgi:hypothetical protein
MTKILPDEDYDSEDGDDDDDDDNDDDDDDNDDDDNDDDYGDEITEVPQNLMCEDGFVRNESSECIGKYSFGAHPFLFTYLRKY